MIDQRTVEAARAGDRQALDELVVRSLPLVYNIVGRALNGHGDTDDVVQETMIRVIGNLGGLRDPARYRPWLVAIAVRQVRDRVHRRRHNGEELAVEPAGPDFAELTILRLQLEGERREVAESVRWLDDADRQVFSLWCLELAGELTRPELASALGLTRQHVAVRVQRMKSRLETARGIVRALEGGCRELAEITGSWDGHPDSLWRKRLARHVRSCPTCGTQRATLPAERLLAGLALVPLPVGFALGTLVKAPAAAAPAGLMAQATAMLAKPMAAVTLAGGVAVAGGSAYVFEELANPPPPPAALPLGPTLPAPESAEPRAALTPPAPSPRRISLYGSVVDTVDRAPDPRRRPGPLPRRRETGMTLSTGDKADLKHRGENVTFRGRGYLLVRWQVMNGGQVVMPTWTALTGKLFHVASGGGRRLDDRQPGTSRTWMGLRTGTARLPPGAQQMWQNEYYHLSGSVTLNQNESSETDYNIFTKPVTHTEIVADIGTPPDGAGIIRYGLVRDTGGDSTPVPQYLTRTRNPAQVPQQSRVR
ncbi:RNA polymerase sigma factor [Actinomadura rudentiformis]|uniref:RNA polymerase sigma factor n=1 Tax=Actinomadura rudentiformis TaxID=359158 RepID=UPI001CEF9673|nr:sigma-70 family RNA polymerase sigma factor [Actinomadura rudentiformis]